MIPEKYFEKFPIITYSNNQVVDITRRVALLDRVSSNPYVFYPYDISSEERADQLSNRYYEDSYMSWLLYLTNKIVDPYYEWYMHENEFSEFIIKKYGSEEKAKNKTKYYRNDWANTAIINQSAFNALSAGERKYWEPYITEEKTHWGLDSSVIKDRKPWEYDNDSYILSIKKYKRKEKDWTVNTNKVVSYKVMNSNNYIVDEICKIWFNKDKIGYGQVVSASNNYIVLQHISGDYLAEVFTTKFNYRITDENGNFIISDPSIPTIEYILYEYKIENLETSYILGTESNTKTQFLSSTLSVNNIPDEELAYWRPVSYYDYEYEKNEYYKSIRVIDSSLKYTAVDNLRNLLEE